jgi:hypothetical protein
MAETVLNYSPLAPAISPASPGEAQLLRPVGDHKAYNIVHLIYRARNYEGHSKDYDFSRASMQEHWRAAITTPFAPCAIRKCSSALRITKSSSPSICPKMAANRTGFVDVPLARAAAQPCDHRTNGQLT